MLDYPLENFRIYVDNSHHIISHLPLLEGSSLNTEMWSDSSTYYRSLFATYCASYFCDFLCAAHECRGSPNNRKCDAVPHVFHYYVSDEANVVWGAMAD